MIENIKRDLERNFGIRTNEETETYLTADCRNWGQWEFPEDESCEDGEDEDCDYEELSYDSYNLLKMIILNMNNEYPGFKITQCTGEKNYIDFEVRKI